MIEIMKMWEVEQIVTMYANKIAIQIKKAFPFIDSNIAVEMAIAYLNAKAKEYFYSDEFEYWCSEAVGDFRKGMVK